MQSSLIVQKVAQCSENFVLLEDSVFVRLDELQGWWCTVDVFWCSWSHCLLSSTSLINPSWCFSCHAHNQVNCIPCFPVSQYLSSMSKLSIKGDSKPRGYWGYLTFVELTSLWISSSTIIICLCSQDSTSCIRQICLHESPRWSLEVN
jgi:hypothetical protein